MRRKHRFTFAPALALLALILQLSFPPGESRADTVLISEVLVDAPGSDNGKTFVEIAGTPGMSLAGYTLVGVNGGTGSVYLSIDLSAFVIPGDGIFVAADSAGGVTEVAQADALFAALDPQNGPDSLQIRFGAIVIDALGYGDFTSAVFAGEGSAVSLPPAGSSLSRPFADADTNDNAADFVALAAPTPGTASFSSPSPVPEPASLLLLGASLLTFGRRLRPRPAP